MKKLLMLVLFCLHAFAIENSFLDPQDAFKTSIIKEDSGIKVQILLGKDIYLYDEKLKLIITKPQNIDLTKEIGLPKPVEYDGFIVHLQNINITIPFELLKKKIDTNEYTLELQWQGCSKAGLCYAPMTKELTFSIQNEPAKKTSESTAVSSNELNETDSIAQTLKNQNAFWVLITFFGFGLLLALTPCVFPMIPILSSIIVKASDSQEMTATKGFFFSLVYVLAMSVAYTIAGVLAGLFGANLQVALQNPYVLTVFAAIFVALAFSMFGYFKLELPKSLQNKIQNTTQSKQGVLGIAIMGFLSALIVGPCVAPPLAGALVYIGQTGDAVLGGAALFVLSLGMGVPLLLIGIGAGKFMPKPGGWMESITKIFGIIMLAIAVWMLDRVLEPIIVMYLWALLLIGAALYLKMYSHIIIRLITTVIFIYGVLTFVGAVSGATNVLKPLERLSGTTVVSNAMQNELQWQKVKNLKELDVAIKASNKPVMLDFYADWCVSCKELEQITFKDEAVIQKLQGFTLLKADVTQNSDEDKALQKQFGVVGPPALIFWDKNNNEIKAAQIVGYKNPKDFLDIVNKYF